MAGNKPEMEGEVYYPSAEVIEVRVADQDQVHRRQMFQPQPRQPRVTLQ